MRMRRRMRRILTDCAVGCVELVPVLRSEVVELVDDVVDGDTSERRRGKGLGDKGRHGAKRQLDRVLSDRRSAAYGKREPI